MNSGMGGTGGSISEKPGYRILVSGQNCWRIATVRRAAVLVDGDEYFARLEWALRAAERSVLIVGWDFDGRMSLRPGSATGIELRDLLLSIVRARPDLAIRILIWDFSVFYGPGASLPLLLGEDWQEHPQIQLRLDNQHPLYGACHQKLVCIDDALAFAGGIDLTVERWDTCRHAADDPDRVGPDGDRYSPVHDLQMLVDGEAASALGEVARDRWRIATGETVPPISTGAILWPPGLGVDFAGVPVAIARTVPARGTEPAVREVALLTRDCLMAAQRMLYIETQYLSASSVADVLAARLASRDGPEIVIIATEATHGVVERWVMGANRDRLIRRLKQADRFNRLRVYHPVVPRADGDCQVLIHSKLIIVDEEFVRIGSSNLNNRSMGLDTECDLGVEAADDATRRSIAALRGRLLAEHLDTTPNAVAQAIAVEGSLIRAVERLNRERRGLRSFDVRREDGPSDPIPGTGLLDPEEPFEPLRLLRDRRDG